MGVTMKRKTTFFLDGIGLVRIFVLFSLILALGCASLHNKMKKALEQNDLPMVKRLAQEALQKNPNDPVALDMMGKVLLAQGKPDSAITYFRKARKLDPQNADFIRDLRQGYVISGDSLVRKGLTYAASQQYEKAVELDSSDFNAWRKLGAAQKTLGQYDKARISYQRALRIHPEADSLQRVLDYLDAAHVQSNLLLSKGKDLLKRKRYKQAMSTLEKAVKAKPDNEEAQYYYHMAAGLYYFKRGSLKQLWDAIDHFGKASVLRPNDPEPHFYMAQAYLKKDDKDFDNVIREYEEVIKLAPDSPLAARAKKQIIKQKKRQKLYRDFWKKK